MDIPSFYHTLLTGTRHFLAAAARHPTAAKVRAGHDMSTWDEAADPTCALGMSL